MIASREASANDVMMIPRCWLLILILLLAFVSGCSSYDARWRAAAATNRKDSIAGAWKGRWESGGHPGTGGKLWCIVEEKQDGKLHAEFKATWHGVFKSEHEAVLPFLSGSEARKTLRKAGKNARAFAGEASVHSWIGAGSYRCEGWVNTVRMSASYDAIYDKGTFELVKGR